jgi:hypothetical protein
MIGYERGVTGQTLIVFVFDNTNQGVAGESANLTLYYKEKGGSVTQLTDTTFAELDATNAKGYYEVDLGSTEIDSDYTFFFPQCSTADTGAVMVAPAFSVSIGFFEADLATAVTRILDYLTETVAIGTVQTVTDAGEYTMSTNLSASDAFYARMFAIPQDGPAAGQPRVISTYTGTSRTILHEGSGSQLTAPFTVAPEAGNTIHIKGLVGTL